VFFLSSRVHPGETPSSFVFNGFFDFIFREDDARAIQLRRQYVFKLVPMLNPDGVVNGHYRTDARGVNLNRVYLDPSFELHPSVYAVKSILVFHHVNNRVRGGPGDVYPASTIWVPNVPPVSESAESLHSDVSAMQASSDTVDNTRVSPVDMSCTAESTVQSVSHRSPDRSVSASNGSVCQVLYDAGFLQPGSPDSPHPRCSMFDTSTASCNEAASGGECEDDLDGDVPVGNEGSDDEEDSTPVTEGIYSPHLSDALLRTVAPANSGIAFYVDLHAHASKRGCFMYGNCLEDDDAQLDNVLYARLVAINSAHFDFDACNFTERNMYSMDRKEGLSKEGSGRVALYKTLGIKHWYSNLLIFPCCNSSVRGHK